MKKVFLDTETTGLTPGQIAQIAYIIEDDSGNVKGKNFFFTVDHVDSGARAVTHRGEDEYKLLSKGLKFVDKANEIFQDLQDAWLIAHNEPFDEKFLFAEFWRLGLNFVPAARFDTMEYFKNICKIPRRGRVAEYKNPKLTELVGTLSIDRDKIEKYCRVVFGDSAAYFHDAMFDTTAMFVAFQMYRETQYGGTAWKSTFTVQN